MITTLPSGIVKIVVLTITLYVFSQHYQGIMLTIIGLLGCLWILSDLEVMWKFIKIEKEIKDLKLKGKK